jgi:hypothetical protein
MTDTTDAPGHDATGGDFVVSVADAAAALGISEGAVRKRIERGQLAGRKVHGQWRVVLNATDVTRRDATDTTRHDEAPPVAVSPAATAQLAAIRDEWLQPLVEQLKGQAEEIGRLEERLITTLRERDALKAENDALRAAHDQRSGAVAGHGEASATMRGVDDSPASAPQRPVQRATADSARHGRWWRWLRRG